MGEFGDVIVNLPTDPTPPSHEEAEVVETFFQKNQGFFDRVMADAKDALVLGFLFALLISPPVEETLKRFFPSMASPFMSILIRTLVFVLIYYVLKNLHVVRK